MTHTLKTVTITWGNAIAMLIRAVPSPCSIKAKIRYALQLVSVEKDMKPVFWHVWVSSRSQIEPKVDVG